MKTCADCFKPSFELESYICISIASRKPRFELSHYCIVWNEYVLHRTIRQTTIIVNIFVTRSYYFSENVRSIFLRAKMRYIYNSVTIKLSSAARRIIGSNYRQPPHCVVHTNHCEWNTFKCDIINIVWIRRSLCKIQSTLANFYPTALLLALFILVFFSLHTFIKATNTDVHTCIPEHWHSFTVN